MVERIEALAAVVRAHAGLELLPFSAESLLTARGGTIHWISREEAFNMGHGCILSLFADSETDILNNR